MLEARGLRKSYGDVTALDGVDMDIQPGEVHALIGPNGAGKTTLINLIAGLRSPDAGTVRIGGVDPHDDPLAARRMLGIAPQELGVYLQLSARKNLRFFGTLAGLDDGLLDARIEEVAAALEIDGLLERKAHELSGGEKRRLHTAAAMLHDPPLLLLDEPTAGVDVETRSRLLEVVRSRARAGTAICYTTHYLHEVESIAAAVTILDHGRVIASGKLRELLAASAQSVLEIQFEGPLPAALASRGQVDQAASVVRIETGNPGHEITQTLALIGDATAQIESIEIVRPSLESVYLSVTGRRFEAGAPTNSGP